MKPLNKLGELTPRPEIVRAKRRYGALYGLMAGLGFAISAWGMDAYMLQNAHGYSPWLKFLAGLVLCGLWAMIIGWLAEYKESSLFSAILWTGSAIFFAWLVNAIPLQITPALITRLNPQLGSLLHYDLSGGFMYRGLLAFLWIVPFLFITGVTQMSIVESGAFATTLFGKIVPLLFCITIMGIGGWFTDDLINSHFRDAVLSMDDTIQFAVDNQGQTIDPTVSRNMHLGSLRSVGGSLTSERYLFVSKYDSVLGTIDVLVKFQKAWFDCQVIYNQPANCKGITSP